MDKTCPLCERHCPESDPGCKRGERYFFFEADGQEQELRLIGLFYRCAHMFVHRSGHEQGKSRILSILYRHGNMTQRELLNHTDIRSASLSELLAKIESNGDIRRERSSQDARNLNISLTDKGKAEAGQVENEQVKLAQDFFAVLSQEEKDQLESLLMKLLSSWRSDQQELFDRRGGRRTDHRMDRRQNH